MDGVRWRLGLVSIGMSLAVVLVACGGGGGEETATPSTRGTPSGVTSPSPSAGGGISGTPTAQATPTAAGTEQPSGSPTAAGTEQPSTGGGEELEISAVNIMFTRDRMQADAGTITIVFENNDAGIPHNFAIYPSSDELNNPIAKTDIEAGEVTQRLTVDLEPGEYFYQCDVHPTLMTGALIVE